MNDLNSYINHKDKMIMPHISSGIGQQHFIGKNPPPSDSILSMLAKIQPSKSREKINSKGYSTNNDRYEVNLLNMKQDGIIGKKKD